MSYTRIFVVFGTVSYCILLERQTTNGLDRCMVHRLGLIVAFFKFSIGHSVVYNFCLDEQKFAVSLQTNIKLSKTAILPEDRMA